MINMGLNPGTKFYAQLVSLNQHAVFPYREIMAHRKSIPPPSLVSSFQPMPKQACFNCTIDSNFQFQFYVKLYGNLKHMRDDCN